MIEAVEVVLKHWGAYKRFGAGSGGLASPAGTLVEWKGCPPRTGSSGSRLLLTGAGPDYLVAEVDLALGFVVEQGEGGDLLWRLACRRYGHQPELSVDEQIADLDIGRGDAGRRAYTRAVHRLHELLQRQLIARQSARVAGIGETKREGDHYRRASLRQLEKAHAARVKELFRGGPSDHSSPDSAPVGSGATRQAPVRNNR